MVPFHRDKRCEAAPGSSRLTDKSGFTFVDGIVTEFEDLGRLPGEIFLGP